MTDLKDILQENAPKPDPLVVAAYVVFFVCVGIAVVAVCKTA